MSRALVGALVVALVAIAIFSLTQVACYEMGRCGGSSYSYASYMLTAILSVLLLSLVYIFSIKLQKR
ncbi:MAG: hypothetical protein DRJ43_01270 [Thermoprotei archaeon]|nr:MAG: hypothetical protein DRJ43_01270 [Thermoprotei archaeon]